MLNKIKIWSLYLSFLLSKKKRATLPSILYWTSIYDKEGNTIDPIQRIVKYLDKDHIRNIYSYFKRNRKKIPFLHHLAFQEVLSWKPIIKFNNGAGAILCVECFKIIKTGLTEGEIDGNIDCLYCEECKNK